MWATFLFFALRTEPACIYCAACVKSFIHFFNDIIATSPEAHTAARYLPFLCTKKRQLFLAELKRVDHLWS